MAEVQRPKRKRLSPSAVFAADAEIDVVKDLLQKIEGMKREVDTLRTNLASTGDTVAENTALKADLEKFKADADDFSGLLDELSRRVAAGFGATLGEVLNAVDNKKIITSNDVLKSVGDGSTGFIPAYLDLIRLYIMSKAPSDKKNILSYIVWMERVNRQRPEIDKVVPVREILENMDEEKLSEFFNVLDSPVLDYEISRGTKGFIEPSADVVQYRENVIGNADSSAFVSAMQVEPVSTSSQSLKSSLSQKLKKAVDETSQNNTDAARVIWEKLKISFEKLNTVGTNLAKEYNSAVEKDPSIIDIRDNPTFGKIMVLLEAFKKLQTQSAWGVDRRPVLIENLVPQSIFKEKTQFPNNMLNCLVAIAMWTKFVGPLVQKNTETSDAWYAFSILQLLNTCPKDSNPVQIKEVMKVIDENLK